MDIQSVVAQWNCVVNCAMKADINWDENAALRESINGVAEYLKMSAEDKAWAAAIKALDDANPKPAKKTVKRKG